MTSGADGATEPYLICQYLSRSQYPNLSPLRLANFTVATAKETGPSLRRWLTAREMSLNTLDLSKRVNYSKRSQSAHTRNQHPSAHIWALPPDCRSSLTSRFSAQKLGQGGTHGGITEPCSGGIRTPSERPARHRFVPHDYTAFRPIESLFTESKQRYLSWRDRETG